MRCHAICLALAAAFHVAIATASFAGGAAWQFRQVFISGIVTHAPVSTPRWQTTHAIFLCLAWLKASGWWTGNCGNQITPMANVAPATSNAQTVQPNKFLTARICLECLLLAFGH